MKLFCDGCIHLREKPRTDAKNVDFSEFHCAKYGPLGFIANRLECCDSFATEFCLMCHSCENYTNDTGCLEAWHGADDDCLMWTHIGTCPECQAEEAKQERRLFT